MKTFVLVEVTHSKPIDNLAALIAGRAWTIDGVEGAEVIPESPTGRWIPPPPHAPEFQQMPSQSLEVMARKVLMKQRLMDFFNETQTEASPLDDPQWIKAL